MLYKMSAKHRAEKNSSNAFKKQSWGKNILMLQSIYIDKANMSAGIHLRRYFEASDFLKK